MRPNTQSKPEIVLAVPLLRICRVLFNEEHTPHSSQWSISTTFPFPRLHVLQYARWYIRRKGGFSEELAVFTNVVRHLHIALYGDLRNSLLWKMNQTKEQIPHDGLPRWARRYAHEVRRLERSRSERRKGFDYPPHLCFFSTGSRAVCMYMDIQRRCEDKHTTNFPKENLALNVNAASSLLQWCSGRSCI